MVFFGYISSLVVALTLTVFYIGNVAHHVFASTNKQEHTITLRSAECYSSSSYFSFSAQKEHVTQSIAEVNKALTEALRLVPSFVSCTQYFACNQDIPISVYHYSLFSRPPPIWG